MTRVLYRLDAFVFMCPHDSTVVEIEISELDPESIRFGYEVYYRDDDKVVIKNGWLTRLSTGKTEHTESRLNHAKCPICDRYYRFDDMISRPNIKLVEQAGNCQSCGAQLGKGDKVCNQCSAPVEGAVKAQYAVVAL